MAGTPPQHKVIYLSDAHLFFGGYGTGRTRETLHSLFDACANNDVVVLNGDIFEVPFSHLGFASTTARVMSVLEYTLRCFPNKQINYTIGNHDCDPVFVLKMKELAKQYPNFQVAEKELVLGSIVSTHGDLVQENAAEHKVPFSKLCPPQFSLAWFGNYVPKWVQHNGDKHVSERILLEPWSAQAAHYFQKRDPEQYAKTTTFVLGHTHLAGDVCYDGKEFLNTGVTFDRKHYSPVILTINDEVYREYCARPKEQEPALDPKYTHKRALKALGKIDKEHKAREEAVAVLNKRLETKIECTEYIDQVMAISHLYESKARSMVK